MSEQRVYRVRSLEERLAKSAITVKKVLRDPLILPALNSSVESVAHSKRLAVEPLHETNFIAKALGLMRSEVGIAVLPASSAEAGATEFTRTPSS